MINFINNNFLLSWMNIVFYYFLLIVIVFIFFVRNNIILEFLGNCIKDVCYSLKNNKGCEKRIC